jgi:phosphoribosylamine---glycine ligase
VKVLVIGSGGREHALAWKLAQSQRVHRVYVCPGNGGTAVGNPAIENLAMPGGAANWHALADWAKAQHIDLTVVGPEAPLSQGVVDVFTAKGLRIFGPTQAAAQLESSKAFSKAFMVRHGIPTAAHDVFTDEALAKAYVTKLGAPIVVKADGLAAGKGVVVASTVAEAHEAVDSMLAIAGGRVVVEEFLDGEEASFIVVSDGKAVCALATSQDHKRVFDGDTGPNTGGMGAYSPAPVITPEIHARVLREVIMPTIKGMQAEGMSFRGFLYAGLMVRPDGRLGVLEFNTRMGDPETQPILMRMKSDLFEMLWAATAGKVEAFEPQWDRRTALGVVIAAHGYPAQVRTGDVIKGVPAATDDAVVFHAGTQLDAASGELCTSGGRVLCATALGDSARVAQQHAYDLARHIHFDGMHHRRDIGHRAIKPR